MILGPVIGASRIVHRKPDRYVAMLQGLQSD